MKVNSITVVSTQESRIPATNHARNSIAPFLGSCDRTSTDSLCVKCETENNDISTPRMITLMTGKACFFYHPANHNRSRQIETIKQVTCRYSVWWGTNTDRSPTDSIVRSSCSTGWPGELSTSPIVTYYWKSPQTSYRFNTALSSRMGVKYSNSGW